MSSFLALATDTLASLRQHPLRSLLSVLGLVIGVAALVSILALADGMERFMREQIGTTTSLQNLAVTPRTTELVDGVPLRRTRVEVPAPVDAAALARLLEGRAVVALAQTRAVEVGLDTVRTAARLFAADTAFLALGTVGVDHGRTFTAGESRAGSPVVVVTEPLAVRLVGDAPAALGRRVTVGGIEAEIVGVLAADAGRGAEAYGPFAAFAAETERQPPGLFLRAAQAEEVEAIAGEVSAWLDERFAGGSAAFSVSTGGFRVRQVRQGMLMFKLVFGLITGISVVVGGVGVMNVLLVTVAERTREIGIRKAVGARRRDVLVQFLAEAMAVSGLGSAVGAVVGLLAVFAAAPLIRHYTEAPFRAAVTLDTLLLVAGVAVVVGLVFGTYPARRAARMSPVEAMRHE